MTRLDLGRDGFEVDRGFSRDEYSRNPGRCFPCQVPECLSCISSPTLDLLRRRSLAARTRPPTSETTSSRSEPYSEQERRSIVTAKNDDQRLPSTATHAPLPPSVEFLPPGQQGPAVRRDPSNEPKRPAVSPNKVLPLSWR